MCMSCSKKSSSGTAKAYSPAKKSIVHRNTGTSSARSVGSTNFGAAKVTAKFSGRSR